jgi:hypothetical protein
MLSIALGIAATAAVMLAANIGPSNAIVENPFSSVEFVCVAPNTDALS